MKNANANTIRFATFNVALFRHEEGQLARDLSTPDNAQICKVAEIIQRNRPDVLLVNEFDYDATGEAADLFQQSYLAVSQNGADPITFAYRFLAPSNTGILSGHDQDRDGRIALPEDGYGFGEFPGQYGMLVLSKYPIDTAAARTFQYFLWKDMPGARLPVYPDTGEPYYSAKSMADFRLSSKNHWDLPLDIDGTVVHLLASHPTPPVYDGPENRNGARNHDEIRLWADYITPGRGDYLYDDKGVAGGLAEGAHFVIMGDQNADPHDGASVDGAIQQLLDSPLTNTSTTPASAGAEEQVRQRGDFRDNGDDAQFDTVDLPKEDGRGNLRIDYVLPSVGLGIADSAVFWPATNDPYYDLVGVFNRSLPPPHFPSSDHRLVWVDVVVPS